MYSLWQSGLLFLAEKIEFSTGKAVNASISKRSSALKKSHTSSLILTGFSSKSAGCSLKSVSFSLTLAGVVALTFVPLAHFSIAGYPILNSSQAETDTFNPIQEIEKLAVKGRAPKTGFSRSAFGPQWSDVDRNGCDTRNDILKRDLTSIVFRDKTRDCVVERGVLNDPYSGQIIEFQRGEKTSALVQIDHVVPLSNAWQTGIFQMSQKVRTSFANDPLNLMAVKGSLNSQKSDGDAATWLPPNKSFRCAYVTRQIQVKVKYGLWLTKPEKEAMLRILQSKDCLQAK